MQIPKSFKIMGQEISVVFDENLATLNDSNGEAHYRLNEIKLQSNRKASLIEHTFLHELVHFILYYLAEEKLRTDEAFVDKFAGLLHQALTTLKFE